MEWVLLAVFILVIISRSIQLWEWGLEVYGIATFWVAYEYGLTIGLYFTIFSSVAVIAIALAAMHHFLNHSFAGPFFQSIDLMIVTILGGIAGYFTHPAIGTLIIVALGCVVVGRTVQSFLSNMFIGLPWLRLIPGIFISVMVNYKLLIWMTISGYQLF